MSKSEIANFETEAFSETLMNFIAQELLMDGKSFDVDDNLLLDVGIDSLGLLRLVSFIETELNMRIPPSQFTVDNFRSINAIVQFLSRSSLPGHTESPA